jgi:AcrR family transcriptional regulator
VQHHFGGKEGILRAVLEDSFERFAERLAHVPVEGVSLASRVSGFVDASWAHFGSPDYRSTFEILLNAEGDEAATEAGEPIWQSEMFTSWNRVWSEIFSDVVLPRRKTVALQTFAISMFSGMAALAMLDRAIEPVRSAELELLKQTLLREMSNA